MSRPVMGDRQWAEWLAAERVRLSEYRARTGCCGMCQDPDECEAHKAAHAGSKKPVYCPRCGLQCGRAELEQVGCCSACFKAEEED